MTRTHVDPFLSYRKRRREAVLRKMQAMRAAKARKRMEREPEQSPKWHRWYRFEFGVRDKTTGEVAWHDLVSVRHAAKALGLIQKYLAC